MAGLVEDLEDRMHQVLHKVQGVEQVSHTKQTVLLRFQVQWVVFLGQLSSADLLPELPPELRLAFSPKEGEAAMQLREIYEK